LVAQHRHFHHRPHRPEGRARSFVAEIDEDPLEGRAVLVQGDEGLMAKGSQRMEVELERHGLLLGGLRAAQAAFAGGCSTTTIQLMPNLSASMPKRGEKKVLPSGMCTCPPSASAANSRSASASFLALSAREKPLNSGLPWAIPSDAMTAVSP